MVNPTMRESDELQKIHPDNSAIRRRYRHSSHGYLRFFGFAVGASHPKAA